MREEKSLSLDGATDKREAFATEVQSERRTSDELNDRESINKKEHMRSGYLAVVHRTPNAVAGFCYRSTPIAFINNAMILDWLHEVRCWVPGWLSCQRAFESKVQNAATQLRMSIKFFSLNAADMYNQPTVSYPAYKGALAYLCEARDMAAIREGKWAPKSGALANSGKKLFFEMAAECIRRVNLAMDVNNDNWSKKSMLQYGLDVPGDDIRRLAI
ncbi:hypothetical protein GQ600_16435 [Phytophthora cactorum]|nr:hypothetical protein GQ600_16435 [Phytophthora cactorum]